MSHKIGEQDPIAGESWVRRAALAGDPEAATFIANLYARSGPLPPNYSEAAGWYRRAAEAGQQPTHCLLRIARHAGAGQI
jgi:TPR repeat protein